MMNSQTSAKICLHFCCWMFLSYWMFQKRTVTKKFFNGIQSPSSSTSNRGNFLPDLLAALMPPYLRALLGTRQERALLIQRASITIKTFINECNVKEMIIFLRLIKRTMLNGVASVKRRKSVRELTHENKHNFAQIAPQTKWFFKICDTASDHSRWEFCEVHFISLFLGQIFNKFQYNFTLKWRPKSHSFLWTGAKYSTCPL